MFMRLSFLHFSPFLSERLFNVFFVEFFIYLSIIMAKMMKKVMQYDDVYYGDFSLDVPRLSHHASRRAKERKIPREELLQSRSHINGYVKKIESKTGVVITAYPRGSSAPIIPENGRCFQIPFNGIGIFIGKQHENINRTKNEYNLKSLRFDQNNNLIAVAPTKDYDWTQFNNMIENVRKRKYLSPEQIKQKQKIKN